METLSHPLPASHFDTFAWLYNQYWSVPFCDSIFPFVEKILLKQLKPGNRLIDLCCGSGHFLQRVRPLRPPGFKLAGLDGSGEMLKLAQRNNPERKPLRPIQWIKADVRTFKQPPVYHAVTAFCSSFNHCCDTYADLRGVFKQVEACMGSKGHFFFDVVLDDQMEESVAFPIYTVERADHSLTVKGTYDRDKKMGQLHIATRWKRLDSETQQEHWEEYDIVLFQRSFTRQQVEDALKEAGLTLLKSYHSAQDWHLPDAGPRQFFWAQK